MNQNAKDAWIFRVLGVSVELSQHRQESIGTEAVSPTGEDTASEASASVVANENEPWTQAQQNWRDANDIVNDQLAALRAALLDQAASEPDLASLFHEIADKGLNAVTANHRVSLMAALLSVGDGSPAAMAANAPKALQKVVEFQSFIDGSDMIRVCDDNPLAVAVSIKATLRPALDRLASALQPAA